MESGRHSCATTAQLAAISNGELPEAEINVWQEHFEGCAHCRSRWQLLEDKAQGSGDGWRSEIAGAVGGPPVELPATIRQALERTATERPVSPDPVQAGDILGRYQLQEEIGRGGMGVVYRATHRLLGKQVALKLLRGDRPLEGAATARFLREIKAAGTVEHPHIVAALDADSAEGWPFLVMELLAGEDLASLARRCGALPLAETCQLGLQLAGALAHVHAHGFLHRDVKPSNAMLTPQGVKLLDLGLAGLDDHFAGSSTLTHSGQLMGTLDYMAPEQFGEVETVGPPSDVYGLGATLYRLLTGRPPHGLEANESSPRKIRHLLTVLPRAPEEIRADIPRPLSRLLLSMLSKDGATRPTMEQVAEGLRRYARQAQPETLLRAAPPASPTDWTDSARSNWRRRRALAVALGGLGAIAVVAMAVWPGTVWPSADGLPADWTRREFQFVQDRFIDSEFWELQATDLRFPAPQIAEDGNVVLLINRGYMRTRHAFPEGVRVDVNWAWLEAAGTHADQLSIALRSSGQPRPTGNHKVVDGLTLTLDPHGGSADLVDMRSQKRYAKRSGIEISRFTTHRVSVEDRGERVRLWLDGRLLIDERVPDTSRRHRVAIYNREGAPQQKQVRKSTIESIRIRAPRWVAPPSP